ncbi:ABC transporter permease [Staphylococcus lugdunensis]|uniref:ABC transporter permease n=1 Tax=Staphylococcus lugdunensis TaxID=28035 RepID=A0A133QCT6_STALU|nr:MULTISPECIES: hypothetical protein [Staphylococcus]AMG61812.1 ABC transporter [Staphylococcus lugdunensis]ARJ10325.1 ABC transporter [Staphylococcus lugdunensis]AST61207.1 ABC transporter [Staphylococcus lugdunensis]ATG70061.1 ABC transporter [Staphylococcus lugdunensis]ATN15308.1 ABC transporter [Staphylococcus lugdunensis]
MKPYIQLVIRKQWLQYVLLLIIIGAALSLLYAGQKMASQNFKIPIAIQDMSHSNDSKQLIKHISDTRFVSVKSISADDIYIDDAVKKKEAMISLQIPKDFDKRLAENRLKSSIQLYGRDDFIGNIALEIVSRSLYEQQIPHIIQEHLDKNHHHQSIDKIKEAYKNNTPTSKFKNVAIHSSANHSLSISLIFAWVLMISAIQIVLHQRLKQNAPLGRLLQFNHSRLKLYGTYIVTHTCLLLFVMMMIQWLMHQPLSLFFYAKSFAVIFIYEWGIASLLFKVNTLSHRLFMAIVWSIVIAILFISIQM